jgi:hypothetical protein
VRSVFNAIEYCSCTSNVTGPTLVIANSGLSRDAAFLLTLRKFAAVDPSKRYAFTVGIMVPAAQAAREAISR